jgi:hypothetical protein
MDQAGVRLGTMGNTYKCPTLQTKAFSIASKANTMVNSTQSSVEKFCVFGVWGPGKYAGTTGFLVLSHCPLAFVHKLSGKLLILSSCGRGMSVVAPT